MRIAVEGCCHDELEIIYDTVNHIEMMKKIKVDLLLICGDFEATRNPSDLQTMACPPKYRDMKYFYKYYKGEKKAPVLTIVIGGNHEASSYMQELPYGGWLAPRIYYLGYAGIVNVGGVRIGGISGIYNGRHYHKGHFERPPYTEDSMRSAYHVRSLEVFRLKQVKSDVDIFLSHDWPLHAVHAGDYQSLCKRKAHFKEDIDNNKLGSLPNQEILEHIQPTYWFSAHLHCKYPAIIQHKIKGINPEMPPRTTKFLALDKCLPRRQFLQVLTVPHKEGFPFEISLDAEWLCILQSTNHLLNLTPTQRYMPGIGCKERYDFTVTDQEKKGVLNDFGGDLSLPENFEKTAPAYDGRSDKRRAPQPPCQVNPQTTLLCQMLNLTDPFAVFTNKASLDNPDEIALDSDDSTSETAEDTVESESHTDSESQTDSRTQADDESQADDVPQADCEPQATDESRSDIGSQIKGREDELSRVGSADPKPSQIADVNEEFSISTETSAAGAEVLISTCVKRSSTEEEEPTSGNSQANAEPPLSRKIRRRNASVYNDLTEPQEPRQ